MDAAPQLPLPHGLTFICLDANRMLIRRGVVNFQLADALRGQEGAIVYSDTYLDCPHCHKVRQSFRDADTMLNYKKIESYWCNDCQGTGQILEPWDRAIKRLNIMTWDRVLAVMSTDAINTALRDPLNRLPDGREVSKDLLMKEAARRLEAAAV